MFAKPTLMSLAQYGTRPQRAKSRLRSPALLSKRTIGSWSVGAPFQVGGKFGVGRCGGTEQASLISLTSEERRTRPHIAGKISQPSWTPKGLDSTEVRRHSPEENEQGTPDARPPTRNDHHGRTDFSSADQDCHPT